jgi:uncharacterized protein
MEAAVQKKRCILVFIKSPKKGHVKSRLAAAIGEEQACRLYEYFVLDLLGTLREAAECGNYALKVCFHPPESGKQIATWLGSRYDYLPQRGADLGEKMKNAFRDIFAGGYEEILLVGSDLPDLPGRIIHDAFTSLARHGAVIGPTQDGGYYLIGFRSGCFLPDIFAGIPWSTAEVFERTMAAFKFRNRDVSILPAWQDMDTPEDLEDFRARHQHDDFGKSGTMRCLLTESR